MAQPSVQTSNPASSAVDVYLNVPLYVTFASPGLTEASVTINSCILLNVATQDSVPVDLSYNATTRVLTITPLGALAESTVYTIRFPGTDIAISSSYVLKESVTSDPLLNTINITFTTGIRAQLEDTITSKEATNLSLEGDINLPWHVKAIGPFSIESTVPKNYSHDIAPTLDGSNRVAIKFNKNISGSILEQDWLTIDLYPVLDFTGFYASGSSLVTDIAGYSIPTLSGLSYSGQYIYAQFNSEIPKNAGVTVTVSESVTATDGTEFGPNDYKLSFTTQRYPDFGGIHWLKTELAALSKELTNDYLAAILLKNSLRFYYRTRLLTPNIWISNKWVIYASVIDVLDDLDLNKAIVAGSRRALGDFSVAFDIAIGQATLKQKRAQEELEELDKALFLTKTVQRIEAAVYVDTEPVSREWFNISNIIGDRRFIHYQPNLPMSNVYINRVSKNPSSYYFL